MKNSSRSFIRPDIADLPEYIPNLFADVTRIVKLDANENPYGPSPRARAALAQIQTWNYYPLQNELRDALAHYTNTTPENIVVTNGADEAIDILLRATLEPNAMVLDCPPTFDMYRINTLIHHGRVHDVPRRADFSLDVESLERAQRETNARVVFLASPNNPTGNLLPRADLLRVLELPALIVLDEAYAEFAGESAVELLAQHDNLIILRTFSKWAGLAGLRVGYALAPAYLARAMHKVRAPFNVNVAALAAARASLDDVDYLMANVQKLVAERERMFGALRALKFIEPVPSRTNFLLCHVTGIDAPRVKSELQARGIFIRAFGSPRLREYVRITSGTREQNEMLVKELKEIGGMTGPAKIN